LLASLVSFCGCSTPEAAVEEDQDGVPPRYQALYDELADKLGELEGQTADLWEDRSYDTAFSVELITANSNRGVALLHRETLPSIERTLDSLEEMGIKGIALSINYPILNPDFPRSSEYLDFYREVSAEIKGRGLILIIENTTSFPVLTTSGLSVDYSGLTLEQYMAEKRRTAQTIIAELQPHYLTVENEPLTSQANTGLDLSVENQSEVVRFILDGLDRAGVRVGAGAGTWDDIAYFESLAANTDLDYIDMHIYPIQRDFLWDKTLRISEIARSHGKGLTVGEAWLYKAAGSELSSGPAAHEEIFARDAYSFWIPLDQRFLEALVGLSQYLEMEFINPFWMEYLYAYIEYGPSTQATDLADISRLLNKEVVKNIDSDSLTPTGEIYSELIKRTVTGRDRDGEE
jgi:hypothetical protein